jgi:hypothetical protein
VRARRLYVDGTMEYQASGSTVSKNLPMSIGSHTVTVQATDEAGGIINRWRMPTLSSPLHIHASTPSRNTVFTIQIYVDDALKYQHNGTSIDTNLGMSPGQHHIVAQAWDNGGGTWKSGLYVTVKWRRKGKMRFELAGAISGVYGVSFRLVRNFFLLAWL